jgi:hypothetical protein
MPLTVTLTTFFRPDGNADPEIGPEQYLAGFEDQDGEPWGLTIPLEPDDVDAAVLGGIAFSISMELDGTLLIEAEGRGDAANEAISKNGRPARFPLDDVVRAALDPDLVAVEDDPAGELRTLRGRLAAALKLVDQALGEGEA